MLLFSHLRFSLVFISSFYFLKAVQCDTGLEGVGGFKAEFLTKPNEIAKPRGILLDPNGDILVVSSSPLSRITAVYENGQTIGKTVLVDNTVLGLTHGIAYNAEYLYASSATTVYRWPYTPGQRTALRENPETVVKNLPAWGHETRTLVFDNLNSLYISVGSFQNVDQNSTRARIIKFNFGQGIPPGGFDFILGEVFADGLRNAVGLAFDNSSNLWAVDNGADNLVRDDLGNDINNSNPADELIKLDKSPGSFYGYPYCWTVYDLPDPNGRGTQLAWPEFLEDGVHTDAWCQNNTLNIPPSLPLPAHYAPLGITFYNGIGCDSSPGAFPCNMTGDAFVAFHGSWNSKPKRGFQVARIPINTETRLPTGDELNTILYQSNLETCDPCFRPVDLVFDGHGHLIVTADASSEVIRILYENEDSDPDPTSSTPGTRPSPTPGPNSVGKLQLSGMLVILVALTVIQRQYS